MDDRGVCYVAYGANARAEAAESLKTLREQMDIPVLVVGEESVEGADFVALQRRDAGGRWGKLSLDSLSPFDRTLYLDADTRIHGDLALGYAILADGYDLVIAPSGRQGRDVMGNAPVDDREETFQVLDCREPLGLQAGVFWVAWNERTRALWAAWREEWERFRYQDQPALLRALDRVPVHVWLLSSEFNGGNVVEHLFGRAR